MSKPIKTHGVHHVGLTVCNLEESVLFYTDLLGWDRVGDNPDYPAVFVSDGMVMITLWKADSPENTKDFDKNNTVGLHHLALRLENLDDLNSLHKKLVAADVKVEFSPEPLKGGPTQHMMCYDPNGIRIEFIVPQ